MIIIIIIIIIINLNLADVSANNKLLDTLWSTFVLWSTKNGKTCVPLLSYYLATGSIHPSKKKMTKIHTRPRTFGPPPALQFCKADLITSSLHED